MSRTRHEGFTLIELLIVIVVIGILSVAMMMSGEEASSTARASRVVSDLNAWKRAALAYWADNPDAVSEADFNVYDHTSDIIRYLNVDKKFFDEQEKNSTKYRVIQTSDGCWYIWCDIGWGNGKIDKSKNISVGVTAKLVNRAKSAGLYRATKEDWYSKCERSRKDIEGEKGNNYYAGTNDNGAGERYILMRVR
ncbi:MAG: prepilin-type N-terminal cleavage/methylation domain-containing protein [Synergistaceae bacterium]|nr:prepilin-type N-terminal cleavage/methylation domain-containing protein [Synergistaceae bacterium]